METKRLVKNVWNLDAEPVGAMAAADGLASGAGPGPGRRSGRVRTRLLGYEHADGEIEPGGPSDDREAAGEMRFPVGWLVIVEGPGQGEAFELAPGVSTIGRGEDQAVQLDFGDTSISRVGHAAIAYDSETRGFYIGQSSRANTVRLNGKPVASTEALAHGDLVTVGETVLALAALCGPDFSWEMQDGA